MTIFNKIKDYKDLQSLSVNELNQLCLELRGEIVNVCSSNGGHLAPNLGVVELTVALLLHVDLDNGDDIIWDVGHQSYIYKILTGRKQQFKTIRTYKGISGFPNMSESKYDVFGTGHSSTSISAGMGIGEAKKSQNIQGFTYAVIGDGAMTGGIAYEGMNNLGGSQLPFIIILNDNEMSISENVGGLSNHLSGIILGRSVTILRKKFKKVITTLFPKKGEKLVGCLRHLFKRFMGLFSSKGIFEDIGIYYIGPIDGHNIKKISGAIRKAKSQQSPTLIHVKTVKGKGYSLAEQSPDLFHGVSSFNKEEGIKGGGNGSLTYSDIFADKLCEMAKTKKNIVAITAAMAEGTKLYKFKEKYPERFYDVGIAEQHAITFASGLASKGIRPYVVIYSTFLQRGYDSFIHDLAVQNLPVVIGIDRGGLVGEDGATHNGLYDIAFVRTIPNVTMMLPRDPRELSDMLELSYSLNSPVTIRYPRGGGKNIDNIGKYSRDSSPLQIGEPEIIQDKGDVLVISVGTVFQDVFDAYELLKQKNIEISLINLRFLKPLNLDKIINVCRNKKLIITVEDGAILGGAGEMLQTSLLDSGVNAKFIKLGYPDKILPAGSVSIIKSLNKLDSKSICNLIEEQYEK